MVNIADMQINYSAGSVGRKTFNFGETNAKRTPYGRETNIL